MTGCRIIRNGQYGISVSARTTLRGNVLAGNESWGALINGTLIAAGNIVREHGIAFESTGNGSLIVDNAVTDNTNRPSLGPTNGYARNTFRGNAGTSGLEVSGGVQIGPNLCGTDTTCP